MMKSSRLPMREGTRIPFQNSRDILTVGELKSDSGSSCLVYRGIVERENGSREQVIVKEFYPRGYVRHPYFIRGTEQRLKLIDPNDAFDADFISRKRQFEQGIAMQRDIAFSGAMEMVVRPFAEVAYGDSIYNVNQLHMGEELNLEHFKTLREKLDVAYKIANLLWILEKNRYLVLDYKPQNFLWIGDTREVKLLDPDSIIDLNKLSELRLEDVNCDPGEENPYMPGIVKKILMGESVFEDKKEMYISCEMNRYSLGVTLFYLLFGKYPRPDKVRFHEFDRALLAKELLNRYPGHKKSMTAALGILKKIVRSDAAPGCPEYGYTMDRIVEDIGKALRLIEVEEERREKNQRANFSSVSYHMIRKYPVFRYCRYEGGVRQMEIALFGTHAVRTMFLQTILPACQMLRGELKIRLFSEDAVDFWNRFRKKNPALEQAVLYYIEDELQNEIDADVVDCPLAEIYLYGTEQSPELRRAVREHHIGYILLIAEDYEKNRRICRDLQGWLPEAEGEQYLIGYIGEQKCEGCREDITCARISTSKLTEEYDEKIFQNDVYKMGLAVHTFYEAGEQTAVDEKSIEKKYREAYNFESSQRSAINIIYKLESVGIDYQAEDVKTRFVEAVLSRNRKAEERLQQLIYLEHRSWIAEKLTHGVIPASVPEVSRSAFRTGNDWKITDENGRLRHPCIAASRIGDHLTEADWERRDYLTADNLDPLEKMSIHCWKVSGREAERRKKQILTLLENIVENELLDDIEAFPENEKYAGIWEVFGRYKETVKALYSSGEGTVEKYSRLRKEFEDRLKEAGLFDREMQNSLHGLDSRLQAVIYYNKKRNFKTTDRDMIFAIPDILSRWNIYLKDKEKSQ